MEDKFSESYRGLKPCYICQQIYNLFNLYTCRGCQNNFLCIDCVEIYQIPINEDDDNFICRNCHRRDVIRNISDLYCSDDSEKKQNILQVIANYGAEIEKTKYLKSVEELREADDNFKHKFHLTDKLLQ